MLYRPPVMIEGYKPSQWAGPLEEAPENHVFRWAMSVLALGFDGSVVVNRIEPGDTQEFQPVLDALVPAGGERV
jgi:hypothetical protein